MRSIEVKKDIHWVGAVDYESRDFHGYSLSPGGTTYNSYIVKDEKTALIDTVKHGHFGTLRRRIETALPSGKIDYFIINHVELDHAGCLAQAVEFFKPEKIFCSTMGLRSMQGHYDTSGWPVQAVKTGDVISLGKRSVRFVETRMLHWPDSMFSYIPEDKILFSNDAFGQNIASTARFVDEMERPYILAAMKEYYYNIVLPFSPIVLKTLDAVAELKLDIDTVAPDHGLIFRGKDVAFMLDTYRDLALQKTKKQALIFFDTMWNSTEKMAHAITEGLEQNGVPVRLFSLKNNHHSTVMSALADCGAVIAGSPTHNNGIMPHVSAMLGYMKGLKPQNRIGAAYGSYGWSGEAPKIIHETLQSMGMQLPAEPVKTNFVPKKDDYAACLALGKTVAAALAAVCQE